MKRTFLRRVGRNPQAILKEQIQALLREYVILRDGGCVLREYPETGKCGGYAKDGHLILQFEHLNSRAHAISFSDHRLGACLCQRHHIYWKPQNSKLYWEIIEGEIGPQRWSLLQSVQKDMLAHKVDLKLAKIVLERDLKMLKQSKKSLSTG